MRKVYLIPLIIYPVLFAVIRGIERETWGLKTILGGLFVALLCSGVSLLPAIELLQSIKKSRSLTGEILLSVGMIALFALVLYVLLSLLFSLNGVGWPSWWMILYSPALEAYILSGMIYLMWVNEVYHAQGNAYCKNECRGEQEKINN